MTFAVAVTNNSSSGLSGFGVGFYLDETAPTASGDSHEVSYGTLSSLAAHATATVTSTTLYPSDQAGQWTATAGPHTVTAWANDNRAVAGANSPQTSASFTVAAAPTSTTAPSTNAAAYFSPQADINTPIGGAQPTSGPLTFVAGGISDIVEFGFPVYQATTTATISCNENCPNGPGTYTVLWNPNVKTSTGSDAAAAVVGANGHADEFWQLNPAGLTTNGYGEANVGQTSTVISEYAGSATGANFSTEAGLVTIAELESGTINHALSFGFGHSCSSSVPPATKSDGNAGSPCLPEGTRIQLIASSAPTAGLTPFQLAVRNALVTYGAYDMNNAGSGDVPAFGFEDPVDGQPNWYAQNGVSDYQGFPSSWQYQVVPDV